MSTPVIARDLADGRPLRITIERRNGMTCAVARVADQEVGAGVPGRLVKAVQARTHALGKLAITQDESDRIMSAIRAAVRTERTPIDERRDLATTAQALWTTVEEFRRSLHEDPDAAAMGAEWAKLREAESRARAAALALQDWDAAHPEVVTALREDLARRGREA